MAGLALGGFMGSGKSTVGRALAEVLGLRFVDMDEVLTARFGPIAEQFARDGEAVFRERERALVAELCADPEPQVVSTGGGVWADEPNRRALKRAFGAVVLQVPLEVSMARVGADPERPLWDAAVSERFEARRSAYLDAHLVVDGTAPLDQIVGRICAWAQEAGWLAPSK